MQENDLVLHRDQLETPVSSSSISHCNPQISPKSVVRTRLLKPLRGLHPERS
ncbi:MAG: hypothetical protein RLZZ435_3283 [Cyanobacteriota bacterium]